MGQLTHDEKVDMIKNSIYQTISSAEFQQKHGYDEALQIFHKVYGDEIDEELWQKIGRAHV